MEEEARQGADPEEDVGHGGGDRCALAVAVDGREDHLEGEEGPCGEEVDKH